MKRKKPTAKVATIRYDVIYEDGSRASNRKVSVADLDSSDRDAAARAYFEAQDREIARMSGIARGPIKAVVRSGDA